MSPMVIVGGPSHVQHESTSTRLTSWAKRIGEKWKTSPSHFICRQAGHKSP